MAKARVPASSVVDVGVQTRPIDAIRFLSPSGTLTLKGYYVDWLGYQTGVSFSLSIPVGNGSNDPVGFETALAMPADAVGVVGILSGDAYITYCGTKTAELADFKANYANYPKAISLTPYANTFGRVG